MPYRKYTPEFKESAVAMVVNQKCSVAEAAKNLGVKESTLSYWVRQHTKNGSVSAAEEKDLRKRVAELERENQRLRLEREILKKATAFFAKEQP